MHRQPAIRKWTHCVAVQLMILAVLFLLAAPVHAEDRTASYPAAVSEAHPDGRVDLADHHAAGR